MKKQSLVQIFALVGLGLGFFLFSTLLQPAYTAVLATTVLYDAASGGTPDTQAMEYATYGENYTASSAVQTYETGATTLDTTADMGDYAGYGVLPENAITLDATQGFEMTFTVQVTAEAHDNEDRSGFNVILLDQNAKGIEVGFYTDTIYARHGNGANLFDHAEEISFDTTNQTTYTLEIVDSTYALTAAGMPTLTGTVRDYSDNVVDPPPFPFPTPPDPYEQPNFIFLGDNTTSGQAEIRLWEVTLTTETAVEPTATPSPTQTPNSGSDPTPAAVLNLPIITQP